MIRYETGKSFFPKDGTVSAMLQPTIMNYESINESADDLKSTLKAKLEPLKESAISARDSIREQSCTMCDCATDSIRKNPIAAVVGAAVFGAAVCYLILEGRREASFSERYLSGPLTDAGDSVSSSLRSAYDNFKFW